jgi:hypothetical protein
MPLFVPTPSRHEQRPHPLLEQVLRGALLTGLALVLLLPFARGYSSWLGWLPLWLVGMPAVAWWALYRFRVPGWPGAWQRVRPCRSARPQARRRNRAAGLQRLRVA